MLPYTIGASPKTLKHCPAHTHDSWEIVLNTEGSGTAEIGGRTYPFSPGTIICIPPETPHQKTAEEGFCDLYLHTGQFVPGAGNQAILLHDDGEKSFESLLRLLLRTHYREQGAACAFLYKAAMELLTGWLSDSRADPAVEQIQNELVASFADPDLKITDLLAASGYSPDYIRRRFQTAAGMTPSEYLTSLRITYARELLRQKEKLHLSVSDIGLMCGYYDVHYFSRVFRQSTGLSPRKYAELNK